MQTRLRIPRGLPLTVAASFGALAAACGEPSPSSGHTAHHDVAQGPIAPEQHITSPLSAVMGTDTTPAAPVMKDPIVDARLLVITADTMDSTYRAIDRSLGYLGVPFDVFNATTDGELTASRLARENHAFYQGIILDVGNLSDGSRSAFSAGEWSTLAEYETKFQIRRVALYTYPETAYGLKGTDGVDTEAVPIALSCTSAGAELFHELNCDTGSLTIRGAWSYPAEATDENTIPVLVDGAGKVFGAVRRHVGGRESLVFTFAHSPSLVHSLGVIPDAIRWVTRGLFLGERHVYVGSQIDDLFLSTDLYKKNESFRITPQDLRALWRWQEALRATPLLAELRLDWAANGSGSMAAESLVNESIALGAAFKWISHTWSHPYLDATVPPGEEDNWAGTYERALPEFERNDAFLRSVALKPYSPVNIVTPHVSGLNNPAVMKAAFEAGIRYLVTDTSQPGYDNPTPNAGIYNPHQPEILMIPRRANNLFYHVSTPEEWVVAYNDTYRAEWGRDLTYEEILDKESEVLVRYMLRGENDPWMFHQANARDFGGGRSLLSDLHDRVFQKYAAVSRLPIVSPSMDELGRRVSDRMRYDASGATAVIGPGRRITLRVAKAATVPVTGLCTPSGESYGGQHISYIAMTPATELTFSMDGCNAEGPSAGPSAGPGATPQKGESGRGCSVSSDATFAEPLALFVVFVLLLCVAPPRRRSGGRLKSGAGARSGWAARP